MISGVATVLAGETLLFERTGLAIWLAAFVAVNAVYLPLVEEPQLRAALRRRLRALHAPRAPAGCPRPAAAPKAPERRRGPFRGPFLSWPVSRILSCTAIHLAGPRYRRGFRPAAYLDLAGPGQRSCLALHRAGFAWPPRHRDAGALLPHHFTLACARLSYWRAIGGVISVALSRGFPRVGVTHRPCPVVSGLSSRDSPPATAQPALQILAGGAAYGAARLMRARPAGLAAVALRIRPPADRARRPTRSRRAPPRLPTIRSSSDTAPGARLEQPLRRALRRARRSRGSARSRDRRRAHVRPS